VSLSTTTLAQTGLNIHIGEDGIDIQPDAFVSYYHAAPERITWLQRNDIPVVQWPLLFEVARAANARLEDVWEMRKQHSNWYDVLTLLKVPSSYFYYDVPVEQKLSPPYGRAYGYYRSHPNEIVRWSDADFISFASVKYISDSTHRPAYEAVDIYRKRPNFIRHINSQNIKQDYGSVQHKSEKHEVGNNYKDKHKKANTHKNKPEKNHDKHGKKHK
jgi:hypothetical protein